MWWKRTEIKIAWKSLYARQPAPFTCPVNEAAGAVRIASISHLVCLSLQNQVQSLSQISLHIVSINQQISFKKQKSCWKPGNKRKKIVAIFMCWILIGFVLYKTYQFLITWCCIDTALFQHRYGIERTIPFYHPPLNRTASRHVHVDVGEIAHHSKLCRSNTHAPVNDSVVAMRYSVNSSR